MTKSIAMVDYGMGNLRSVINAFEHVGANVIVTDNPEGLRQAAGIVVPGQGAFRDCMKCLRERNFLAVLTDEVIKNKKPYLGICLGLEILADTSYEGGEWAGLGWVKGVVKKLVLPAKYKVPHLGWNEVNIKEPGGLFKDIPNQACFYFAHSYYLAPKSRNGVAAWCDYGIKFAAAVEIDNIWAVQFHPEKSQQVGLQVIKNFGERVDG